MKFDSITTERLIISLFEVSDMSEMYISWLNDQELMRFSEQRHRKHTLSSCKRYLSSFKNSSNLFLAVKDFSGNLYGTITVYYDINNNTADIGIMIGNKKAKGLGVGFEAWNAIIKWIKINIRPRKITAGCMVKNSKMISIIERSGMQVDCIRKQHYLYNSLPADIIYWSIMDTDYEIL